MKLGVYPVTTAEAGNKANTIKIRTNTRSASKNSLILTIYGIFRRQTNAKASGGTSAVKEPGHFELRKSSSQATRSQGRSQDFTLGQRS